jgi:enoyl-CoA hydratase
VTDPYSKYERLKFDRPHPRVLRLTMTSPIKLNAMDALLHNECSRIWADIDADNTVSAVIITGAGNAFSAGGDLKHEQKTQHDYESRMQQIKEARAIVLGMAGCTKPIISAIRGWTVGAGLACAIMADISIAAKNAMICDGHTKIGVAAGDHATIIWPLLCGMAKAKYYLLTCKTLNGEEAERIGLISLAVDDAELDKTALEIATGLANGAQGAIRWTKRALNLWLKNAEPIFEASLGYEFIGFPGPEAIEGIQSFLDKREPKFPPDATM